MRRSILGVFSLSAVISLAMAADYPITQMTDSVQGRQDGLVLTVLLEKADRGARILVVRPETAGRSIDPRQWILIQSEDGTRQETHCVKSRSQRTDSQGNIEVLLKLSDGLQFDQEVGARVLQGVLGRERGVAATVLKAGRGDSKIEVDSLSRIYPLEQLILQSADGRHREAHCIRWVYSPKQGKYQVGLFSSLHREYREMRSDTGDILRPVAVQGILIEGEPEGEMSPCCCAGKRAGR